jgi:hypothetical protein
VWATVVDRVDLIAVHDQSNRVAFEADNEPSPLAHVGERGSSNELICFGNRHDDLLSTGSA